MESTAASLARVNAFGRAVKPDLPAVDVALAALRDLLTRAEVPYALVGGLAVVHHGYVRTTRDLDVLLEPEAAALVEPLLAAGGFELLGERRWRHTGSGAVVDLLFAGDPIPPHGRARFPSPVGLARSPREGDVVGLTGLVELKLQSGRHQDEADVVGLMQGLDEGDYLAVEAAVSRELRPRLAQLRDDALEERRWRDPRP